MTVNSETQRVVLYDEDCGFCRWSLRKVLAWDRRGALRPAPIQSEEGQTLLNAGGVPERLRLDSWHLALPSGEVLSAGAAAPRLFEVLPGGGALAALTRAFPRTTERVYRWVARNRNTLSRVLRINVPSPD